MPAGVVFVWRLLRQEPVMLELPLLGQRLGACSKAMPRPRYCQNTLPLGSDAPPPKLFGPEQDLPPGLQLAEQGQLPVTPLELLFEGRRMDLKPTHPDHIADSTWCLLMAVQH
jgi:hypothetical protein